VSGCTTEDSVGGGNTQAAPTSASATEAPAFASEEEALAAAEEAYAAYQETEDAIFADGGKHPERIEDFATGEALEAALAGYENFRSGGLSASGHVAFDAVELQRYSKTAEITNVVTLYACIDVSGVEVVNAEGKSVVPKDRVGRQRFELSFDRAMPGKLLKVSGREVWAGDNTCE